MRRLAVILLYVLSGTIFAVVAEVWIRLLGHEFGRAGGLSVVWLSVLLVGSAFAVGRRRRADRTATAVAFWAIGVALGFISMRIVLRVMGVYPATVAAIVLGLGTGIALWRIRVPDLKRDEPSPGKPPADGAHPGMALAMAAAASFFGFAFVNAYGNLTAFIAGEGFAIQKLWIAILLGGFGLGAIASNRRYASSASPIATAAITLAFMASGMWVSLIGLAWTAKSNRFFQSEGLAIAMVTLVPTAFLFGYALVLLLRWSGEGGGAKERRTGLLLGTAWLAGSAGLLLGAFVQIPIFGARRGIFWTAAVAFVFFLVVRHVVASKRKRTALLILLGLLLAGLAAVVPGSAFIPELLSATRGPGQVLAIDHRADGVVAIYDMGGEREISINRVPYAGNGTAMKTAEGVLAHVGMIMHPDPKNVLAIGNGTGYAPRLATLYQPQSVHVIEPYRGVLEIGYLFDRAYRGIGTESLLHHTVADPLSEARRFSAGIDVVLIQAPPVALAGNGRYYSVPFYQEIRKTLREGGIVACRLPLHEMSERGLKTAVSSFASVFNNSAVLYPHTALTPYVLLVAQKEGGRLLALQRIHTLLQKASLQIHLSDLDIDDALDLVNFIVMGKKNLDRYRGEAALHTWNHPILEFDIPDLMPDAWKKNLQGLLAMREDPVPYIDTGGEQIAQEQRLRNIAAGQVMGAIASLDLNPKVLTTRLDAAKKLSPGVAGVDRILRRIQGYADMMADVHASQARDRMKLAIAQMKVGNYEQALELLEDELRESPDNVVVMGNLGWVYMQMNKPEEAIEVFERILRISPDNAEAMRQIGVVRFSTGDFGEAAFWFAKAVKNARPDVELLVQLGMALEKSDSKEEAERSFRQAIKVDPTSVRAHIGYGTLLMNDNRILEAIRQFERAIELDSNNKIPYGNIGMIYFKQKMYIEARHMFERVLEIDPSDPMAKRMLNSIPTS